MNTEFSYHRDIIVRVKFINKFKNDQHYMINLTKTYFVVKHAYYQGY